ncbi:nonribosomal peptide synthetase MxaA [Methylococcus geothermalis]|uniref:nonribosomal peptide synthetase MxaA n=1 Tax=Methylococcus geothermalis TaxID=2681310 RepID=UPI001E5C380D|nr:nonribosomal peptide synthetase MxaA [Methylococcus geothermalis]
MLSVFRHSISLLLGLGCCLAAAAELPAGVKAFSFDTPRAFGYVIGDLIRHEVRVETDAGQGIEAASLPKEGWINRWLMLRRVEVRGEGKRRILTLEYQTFYAPLEVKNLTIPGFELRLAGSGQRLAVPDWTFTTAPIREPSVLRAEGLPPVRPDAVPAPLPVSGPAAASAGFGLAALGALVWWAYLSAWLPFGMRGRYFAEACRELRGLRGQGDGQEALRIGFSCLHQAFNRTLGEPLFIEGLDEFFRAHPAYDPLRNEIRDFFQTSYEVFFGEGAPVPRFGLMRVEALARSCQLAERRRP